MVKVLDLFSGIGGFSLGLERAGFETVAFCEIDKKARQVLKKHWPEVPIFEDVTTLTKDKLDERGISVDVICGGFPCQDISVAGKGAGIEGERSGLWSEFARLISELRPRYAIVENVSALLNRGLDRVLGDLAQIGYDAEWHCIPASAVGAPHRRDRVWIVAYPNLNQRGSMESGRSSFNACQQSIELSRIFSDGARRKQETTGEILAYPECKSDGWRGISRSSENNREMAKRQTEKFIGSGKTLADTSIKGLQGYEWFWPTGEEGQPTGHLAQCSWWAVEPDVGRVAHGVSGRVDRLKQLGNAVVPQIPELIGRAIMECYKK